jgi:hypothetical protein
MNSIAICFVAFGCICNSIALIIHAKSHMAAR